jgi:phosphoglycolate phosphatase
MTPFTCVLWDVDGTIVDASASILRRLGITLDHFGEPSPSREDLVHWIGPPMYDTFRDVVGMSTARAAEAAAFYRRVGEAEGTGYTDGTRTYPGIAELVAEVADAGIAQATASSKPEVQVEALMRHFGLEPHLDVIAGADEDRGLSRKADVVADALRRLDATGADTSAPVLIGDRHHDVDGAAEHGIPVIFAAWGFGLPAESTGAYAVAADATALRALLLRHARQARRKSLAGE